MCRHLRLNGSNTEPQPLLACWFINAVCNITFVRVLYKVFIRFCLGVLTEVTCTIYKIRHSVIVWKSRDTRKSIASHWKLILWVFFSKVPFSRVSSLWKQSLYCISSKALYIFSLKTNHTQNIYGIIIAFPQGFHLQIKSGAVVFLIVR